MSPRVEALVRHYRRVADERMRGLPICNPLLEVEAVAFAGLSGHLAGVLVTPWFMNVVVLPGSAEWDGYAQGSEVSWEFPGGTLQLTICKEADLGTYLTGILFRSMTDFTDQQQAHDVANEVMRVLTAPPAAEAGAGAAAGRRISRRDLFTRLGAS